MSIVIIILVLGAIGLVVYMLFGPTVNAAYLDAPDPVVSDLAAGNRDAEAMAALEKELAALKIEEENNKRRIQSLVTELEAEKAAKDELLKQKTESDKAGNSLEDLKSELADVKSGLIEKDRQLDEAHNVNLNLKKDIEAYHHKLIQLKAENSKMANESAEPADTQVESEDDKPVREDSAKDSPGPEDKKTNTNT